MVKVYLGFIHRQSLHATANRIALLALGGPISAVQRIKGTINLLGDRGFMTNDGLKSSEAP